MEFKRETKEGGELKKIRVFGVHYDISTADKKEALIAALLIIQSDCLHLMKASKRLTRTTHLEIGSSYIMLSYGEIDWIRFQIWDGGITIYSDPERDNIHRKMEYDLSDFIKPKAFKKYIEEIILSIKG